MADIRIKDLTTTAAASSADDYIAVDGTSNGTRKLSAATPSFATSVTVPDVVGPTSTDLTLTGGSTGASLVLGQGATEANVTLNATTSGFLSFTKSDDSITPSLARLLNPGATTAGRYNEIIFGKSLAAGGAGTIGYKSDTATPSNSRLYLINYGANQDSGGIQITNSGNLLIGTTTDAASLAGGLVVNGSGAGAAASSTTTGALRVTGGVGVSGAVYGDELRVKKGGGTSSYINGLTLESGAGAGNFWPGVEWRDATLGSMARQYSYREGGSYATSMVFQTSIAGSATPTTALTLSSAQAATFGGIVVYKNYTVATLPSAIVYAYGEAYVSDATQAAGTSLGSAPTGGGSVKRGVYSDGSSWLLR